jgi:glycosyltransferase involved in cell wall biosynthesis
VKILLIHKLYEYTGGAEVFFRETERVLRENGHEILMIATGTSTPEDPANLRRLEAPDYKADSLLTKIKDIPKSIYDSRKRTQVKAIIEKFKPDIVHLFSMNVHLTPAVIDAAFEKNVPLVGTFNDYRHICPNYKLFQNNRICKECKGGKFYNTVRYKCAKNSLGLSIASAAEAYVHQYMDVYGKFDHFTFSSDFLAQTTQEFWPNREMSWSKLRNPFESRSFTRSTQDEGYILYFGRIIEEKGVDRLIEAAKLLSDIPFKIVGNGPDYEPLQQVVRDSGLTNVEFLGPKWGDELFPILNAARAVVVPSIWHENFPYVINQAFSIGKPVIGSDRGGIPELVENGKRGLIFEPNDVEELAACIRRLYGDVVEAHKMGDAAKAYSDDIFNDEVFYKDIMFAYERTLDAHHSHRR